MYVCTKVDGEGVCIYVCTKVDGEGAPLLTTGMEVCLLHVEVASGDRLRPQSVEQSHCGP